MQRSERTKLIFYGVFVALVSSVASAITVLAVLSWISSERSLRGRIAADAMGKVQQADIKISAPESPAKVFDSCVDLIQRDCESVAGQYLDLAKCLERNREKASRACAERLDVVNSIVLPCEDEFRKFCASSETGGGRVHKCLSDHYDESSDKCKKALVR